MSEKKTEQAMRLFEAMEGVDPKLLARSEKENKVLSFQRYAKAMKAMAACLALIVVGGTCFVMLQNGGGQKTKNEAAMTPMNDAIQKSSTVSQNAEFADDVQQAEMPDEGRLEQNEEAQFPYAESAAGAAFEADSEQDAASIIDELTKTINSSDVPDETPGTRSQEAAENSTSGDKEKAAVSYKGLLTISQKRGKNVYAFKSPSRHNGMVLNLDGGEAVYVDAAKAMELLALMNDLELQPVGKQTLTEYVECGICDEDGVMSEWFRISGKYLQVVGTDEFYEILSEDFHYDAWRAEVEAAMQEE